MNAWNKTTNDVHMDPQGGYKTIRGVKEECNFNFKWGVTVDTSLPHATENKTRLLLSSLELHPKIMIGLISNVFLKSNKHLFYKCQLHIKYLAKVKDTVQIDKV